MIPITQLVFLGMAVVLIVVLMRTIKIVPQKQVKIMSSLGGIRELFQAK